MPADSEAVPQTS